MIQEVLFWLLAVVSVAAAVAVIRLQDIFRAALMLIVCFMTVAGLFVLLAAEFIAVVQVLLYAGAISILIIFAVLLTREVESGNPSNRLRLPALFGAGLLFVVLATAVASTNWHLLETALSKKEIARVYEVFAATPQWLASLLLQQWVLPFEVVSLVLLAAMLGAIVLVRERHP